MKKFLLLFLLFPSVAFAQASGGVTVTGSVTAGHCAQFANAWVLQDSGSACGGGGGGSPGGSTNDVQYNAGGGSFGGVTLGNTQLLIGQTGAAPLAKTMSGDCTITNNGVITCTKINSVAYGTSPSTNTVPVVTGANAITYEAVPNAALANSAITFGATSVSLGGTVTNLNAVNVGPTTAGTGAFTTLSSNSTTTFSSISGSTQCLHVNTSGVVSGTGSDCATGGVSSFTGDGTLISNSASTGAVTATLANAAANTVWGNNTASPAAPGYQTAISISGTMASAADTITSTSASALAVGTAGATNPVLKVDASVANQQSGIAIQGAASGGTDTITAIDPGAAANLDIEAKGSGTVNLAHTSTGQVTIGVSRTSGTIVINGNSVTLSGDNGMAIQTNAANRISFSNSNRELTLTANNNAGSATSPHILLQEPADTTITAGSEVINFQMGDTSNNQQWATGSLATERQTVFAGTNIRFVAASTITNGATIGYTLPGCSTNATCTNMSGIYHAQTALTGTPTNSYGINISADTGATNNYAAVFMNGNVGIGSSSPANTLDITGGISASTTAVNFPGLTASSAAQTGTVCWTTGTGNLTVDTTTTCLLSSLRFKKDILPMGDALTEIVAMNPITFVYKDPAFGTDRLSGLIAEEVYPIDQTLVELDQEGKPLKIRYEGLTALNTKAIQQLTSQVAYLANHDMQKTSVIGAFHKCVSWLPILCAD